MISKENQTEKINQHLSSISIPRVIGSSGNVKTKNKIINHCKNFVSRKNISIDSFNFTDKAEKISIVFFSIISSIICFAISASFYFHIKKPILFGAITLLAFIFLFFNYWIEIFNFIGKFGKVKCESVIVKVTNSNSKNNLIVTAHRDSLSSKPTGVLYFESFKILFFKIPLLLCFLAAVYILLFNFPVMFYAFSILFLLYPLSLLFFAMITSFGNDSPGAYDNATGVAILMNIVEKYSNKKIPLNLSVAFLDCEEAGYGGSFSLAKKIGRDSLVLNLDGIGSGELELAIADGPFRSKTSPILNKLIFKICKKLNIKIIPTWSYLYPGSDHVPFVKRGINATMITSSSFNIHSKQDTLDKVDFNQIKDVIMIIDNLIKEISKTKNI
jgi:hypothetical protein